MYYLEDFLDSVDELPIYLTSKFNEMRDLDEQVEKLLQSCEERSEKAFKRLSAKNGNSPEDSQILEECRKEYKKAVELCSQKRKLANLLSEASKRTLRKLDIELDKYKMELEADNGGITEKVERRVLEPSTQKKSKMIKKRRTEVDVQHGLREVE